MAVLRVKASTATLVSSAVYGLGGVYLAISGKRITNIEGALLIVSALIDFYCIKLVLEEKFPFRGCSIPILLFGGASIFIVAMFIKEYASLTSTTSPYQPPRSAYSIPTPQPAVYTSVAQFPRGKPTDTSEIYSSPLPGFTTTQASNCRDWSTISLSNVGEELCVQGYVGSAYTSPERVFIITFGDQPGDFYLLSYDVYYTDLERGECVRIEGIIERLRQSPVIVITNPESLSGCMR